MVYLCTTFLVQSAKNWLTAAAAAAAADAFACGKGSGVAIITDVIFTIPMLFLLLLSSENL